MEIINKEQFVDQLSDEEQDELLHVLFIRMARRESIFGTALREFMEESVEEMIKKRKASLLKQ